MLKISHKLSDRLLIKQLEGFPETPLGSTLRQALKRLRSFRSLGAVYLNEPQSEIMLVQEGLLSVSLVTLLEVIP